MAGYAQFTRPNLFLFLEVKWSQNYFFKPWQKLCDMHIESMKIWTFIDTHKHHHSSSEDQGTTLTDSVTDLHFVEGLATKLPRETFNIEHPSIWPRHRELSTHWALQLLLAWNHELTAVTPGLHAHTHVWTPQALGRVLWWDQTVIGLVGSRQADLHLAASAAEAVVRLRPLGNTTADQRSLPTATHASYFVRMCTKQNFQRDVGRRSVSSRAHAVRRTTAAAEIIDSIYLRKFRRYILSMPKLPISLYVTSSLTIFCCHSVYSQELIEAPK